jgi:hypothetical protein
MQGKNLQELRLQYKIASTMASALFLSGLAASYGLAEMEQIGFAAVLCVGCIVGSMAARRKALILESKIILAELDELDRMASELHEKELADKLSEQQSIAGIDFDTPAGIYNGEKIYRFAVRNGKKYEYSGLASEQDKSSSSMIIVNGFAYALLSECE